MDMNRDSAHNGGPRRGSALRWVAGLGVVAVLIGGGVALADSGGPAQPAPTDLAATGPAAGQAGALNTVLSSAGSPASAAMVAVASPGTTTPPAAGHPCASAAATLKGAGRSRLARQVRRGCRGRLARLRWLLRGIHGQVTFRTKSGDETLAFERGTVTAVTGSAVTVRASDGTTETWHLVSSTVVRQGGKKVTAASLADGQTVFAGGPVVSGADNARLIVIRPASQPGAPSATPSAAA
jgi:hypothetical protein